jgi:uracil phosphoribosyltransferase
LLKIIRAVKLKKKTLEKNYKNLFDILGYEAQQSIPYSDLIYFLSLYPIDDKMKKKVLFQASLFTVYWEKK